MDSLPKLSKDLLEIAKDVRRGANYPWLGVLNDIMYAEYPSDGKLIMDQSKPKRFENERRTRSIRVIRDRRM